jgi:hypothetical protein
MSRKKGDINYSEDMKAAIKKEQAEGASVKSLHRVY